ncbi:hypothetical protein AB6N24_04975 [Cellulomonas sp. 179-A 4D5 NHS]|uniref:hypothetical protein n=1 Tax=Cellulomonas sp. 179-A 4D5 NHS TaxID=3142378 RepID=UPI0039A31739
MRDKDAHGSRASARAFGGGSAEDGTVVAGRDDRTLTRSDLAAGDLVEVWIGDGCGESSPVTCEVVAIRVAAHAG